MAFTADKARQGSAGGSDYEIENSLRIDDAGVLHNTPAVDGNRTTWTWSGWVKRSAIGGFHKIFQAVTTDSDPQWTQLRFQSDRVGIYSGTNASAHYWYNYTINESWRDTSGWYHIVAVFDTTQSTSADRVKIWVNGVEITALATVQQHPLNFSGAINKSGAVHYLGNDQYINQYELDGYLAEVNFIDGQAKTASDFGEFGVYGEWKPIEYAGTYTGNSFYLNFKGGGIIAATGGTVTTDGNYKVHSFTADGTFTPTVGGFVEYLVIAGGGGGGHSDGGSLRGAGGGGAGGYRTGMLEVTGQSYSITVGDGGAGASGTYTNTSEVGDNSVFSTITSTGGGGGKGHSGSADTSTGGSGGGGSWSVSRTSGGSASPSGQGNDGGDGGDSHPNHGGGGGGGASASGANRSGGTGGAGGAGTSSAITGSSVTRAGGGGGGGSSTGGSGGVGGGGAGQNGTSNSSTSGTANTGGGGGGAADGADAGGAGGTGIVIIRYQFQ
jgi:hypothetical protein